MRLAKKQCILLISLMFFVGYFNFSFGQILADSPLYQQLKASGQLGTVQVNPSVGTLPPAKTKPFTSEKASSCNCYIQPDASYTLAMQPNDDGSSAYIPYDPSLFHTRVNPDLIG